MGSAERRGEGAGVSSRGGVAGARVATGVERGVRRGEVLVRLWSRFLGGKRGRSAGVMARARARKQAVTAAVPTCRPRSGCCPAAGYYPDLMTNGRGQRLPLLTMGTPPTHTPTPGLCTRGGAPDSNAPFHQMKLRVMRWS